MNCIWAKTFLMMIMMMIKGINNNCCDGYDNVNIIVKYSDNKNNTDSSKASLKVNKIKEKVQSMMKTNSTKATNK